ncbi:hypothetical protein NQ314_013972 [Rhamnusium bicolor]|uniref:PiggyBac transposable element-derived protein domain-containing protein n=1 Tax=Rhamnusium bicolor TaxID=1586634 RepID=A0AAV8X405_9CUCU|nr:hypothetical protein NQ314_013972 [Rhamnusium bicolor]
MTRRSLRHICKSLAKSISNSLIKQLYADLEKTMKDRKKGRKWVRTWIARRKRLGASRKLLTELVTEDPESYKNHLRITEKQFNTLVEWDAISAELKLQITMRYLASGDSYASLGHLYRVPKCTISKFLPEVCDAIFLALKDHIKIVKAACALHNWLLMTSKNYIVRGNVDEDDLENGGVMEDSWRHEAMSTSLRDITSTNESRNYPKAAAQIRNKLADWFVPNTQEEWKEIIQGFSTRWNFPYCGGALDGKHIVLRCPFHSGSNFYNYKGSFSIIIFAWVDDQYCFEYIDVGANGRASDEGMAESDQVASTSKKRKITFKNPKSLTDDELLLALQESSDEDEELLHETESDVDFHSEQSDSESEGDDSNEDETGVYHEMQLVNEIRGTEIPEVSNLTHQDADGPVDDSKNVPNWQEIPTGTKTFPFLKINELLVPIPGNNEPVDYFRMIFDDDILNLLVNETNQYAEEILCSQGITDKSRITRWKPGESIARYSDDIMVAKWKDKRDVLYISTEHRNEMVQFVDKRNRSREKPATILHYNRHMGGVDRQDQMTSYYPASRKTIRWYKKLAACALHNWLRKTITTYISRGSAGEEDFENGTILNGSWRHEIKGTGLPDLTITNETRNYFKTAAGIKNKLADWFMEEGAVPWQMKMISS